MAFRVPTVDVSVVDLTCELDTPTTYEEIKAFVKLDQVLPVVVPILCQLATNSTVNNLFRAGVAVLACGRLLSLLPGEPVNLLEPLGHLDHLGEATSHVGHLGHPFAVRVSRILRAPC